MFTSKNHTVILILAGKMIADIVNDLHHKVVEVGMERGKAKLNWGQSLTLFKGIYPSPFHKNLTEEEELHNDEKYYHWVKDSMAKMLEAIGTPLSI